jgi:hypothetical protein
VQQREQQHEREPVRDEHQGGAGTQVPEQAADRQHPRAEGDHRRHHQLGPGEGGGGVTQVSELEEPGGGGGRDGEQERVPGGVLAAEPAPQASGQGGARAARAGDERQRLPQTDDPAIGPVHLVEATRVTGGPLRRGEQQGQDDHRRGDHVQRPQAGLDGVLEDEAEHQHRQGADEDEPRQTRLGGAERVAPLQPLQPGPEELDDVPPEEDQHRRHRAQLDDGVERRAGVLPAEQLGRDAEMGRRADGQKLGDALDEPEEDGTEETHWRAALMPGSPRGRQVTGGPE